MIRSIFAIALLFCCGALSQSSNAPAARLAFEVASVRPHHGPMYNMMAFSSSGPRLTLEVYSLAGLVREAYDLKEYQVIWAPGAGPADDVYYDISAKAEGNAAPSVAEFQRMLQTLLAQRFNLKVHLETRDLPIYALTVNKNGPKFKRSAPDAPEAGLFGVHGRNQTITMPRDSMEALADQIKSAFFLDRPVLDRTGLTGTYDIQLEATPSFRIGNNSQPEEVSAFTAVQDQLGLKLVPAKAAMQVLVIDHIEAPSEN